MRGYFNAQSCYWKTKAEPLWAQRSKVESHDLLRTRVPPPKDARGWHCAWPRLWVWGENPLENFCTDAPPTSLFGSFFGSNRHLHCHESPWRGVVLPTQILAFTLCGESPLGVVLWAWLRRPLKPFSRPRWTGVGCSEVVSLRWKIRLDGKWSLWESIKGANARKGQRIGRPRREMAKDNLI